MRPWLPLASAVMLLVCGQSAHPADDNVDEGKQAFNNRCRTCHSMNAGDNRQGPSLHGIVGRKAAGAEGYQGYSQALSSSDIVWTEELLDRFIANPDEVVPGHNMRPYSGLPDDNERRQLVEYLKSADSNAQT